MSRRAPVCNDKLSLVAAFSRNTHQFASQSDGARQGLAHERRVPHEPIRRNACGVIAQPVAKLLGPQRANLSFRRTVTMQAIKRNDEGESEIDFPLVAGAALWHSAQQLDGLGEMGLGFLVGKVRCRLLSGLAPTGDRLFRKSGFREMSRQ